MSFSQIKCYPGKLLEDMETFEICARLRQQLLKFVNFRRGLAMETRLSACCAICGAIAFEPAL